MILTEYDKKRHERTLIEQGVEIGKKQGIAIGKAEKATEIATNMQKDGMSPDKVKRYTTLSDEQWADSLKGSDSPINPSKSMMIEAIDRAVEHCIEVGILKDFLIQHRAEVKDVILAEYDEKRHEQTLIEQGVEIGKKQGIVIGKTEKTVEIATNMLKDGMFPEKVKQYSTLSDEQWADVLKGAGLSD